jgi:glutamate/aspartate transport system substrate-binding protein
MRCLLTVLLLTVFFVQSPAADELTGTLHKIQKSGTIKIGYRKAQPPMSFLNENGKPVGYSMDLCEQIATKSQETIGRDLKIEYVPVSAEDRFDALAKNKIDILCGATTRTLSRGEVVDFTQLTFVTGASFMTLKGTKIENNFKGKKIGVVKGTTTAVALKTLLEETETDANVVLFDSSSEGLTALGKKKIDAFSADQIVLIGLAIASGNPKQFAVLPSLYSYEPFALAVRKNDSDFRLVADRVISDLYRTGQILKIHDKWLGQFSKQRTSAFMALVKLNALPE